MRRDHFDGVLEPVPEVVPDEPEVPLPLVPAEAGLPLVPLSPVFDVLGDVLEPVVLAEPLTLPGAEPVVLDGVVEDEALLPGVDVSVELVVVDGVVVDGVVEVVVLVVLVWFLSQPATAAPARMKAAARGMSFFMNFSNRSVGIGEPRLRTHARDRASRAL
jgi:hypothetical protein